MQRNRNAGVQDGSTWVPGRDQLRDRAAQVGGGACGASMGPRTVCELIVGLMKARLKVYFRFFRDKGFGSLQAHGTGSCNRACAVQFALPPAQNLTYLRSVFSFSLKLFWAVASLQFRVGITELHHQGHVFLWIVLPGCKQWKLLNADTLLRLGMARPGVIAEAIRPSRERERERETERDRERQRERERYIHIYIYIYKTGCTDGQSRA